MNMKTKANLYLILITAFWGLTFPISHRVIQYISPSLFVFLRFGLAAMCLLPMVFYYRSDKRVVYAGIILGLLNSGTFLFQTIGLEYIDPARSAFITGMSVLFVPFLLPFFKLGFPKPIDILCGIICLLGLYILTGANMHQLNMGDFITMACALCVAMTISFVQWVTHYIKSYGILNFYQVLFTVPVAGIGAFHHAGWSNVWHPVVLFGLVFCVIFATVMALHIQLKYQQYTTATMVALIFVLEPVFASIYSVLLGDTALRLSLVIGGAVIIFSLALPTLVSKHLS
ncbi:MAG: hypothetical protein CMF39_03815 [Legionellaceae bacterium]|nr:hypothetical protein [Legionellaceae bacterium]